MIPFRIYFHLCLLDQEVISICRQLVDDYLFPSKILEDEQCQGLFLFFVGDDDDNEERTSWKNVCLQLLSHPKTKIHGTSPDMSFYERFTLHSLYQDCVSTTEPFAVLYFHTKGISRVSSTKEYPNIILWRKAMWYFLILHYHTCLQTLLFQPHVDAVGCLFSKRPFPHYSGNFWWSHSTYISSLPFPIGPKYADPEKWIGLCWTQCFSLYQYPFSTTKFQTFYTIPLLEIEKESVYAIPCFPPNIHINNSLSFCHHNHHRHPYPLDWKGHAPSLPYSFLELGKPYHLSSLFWKIYSPSLVPHLSFRHQVHSHYVHKEDTHSWYPCFTLKHMNHIVSSMEYRSPHHISFSPPLSTTYSLFDRTQEFHQWISSLSFFQIQNDENDCTFPIF